MTEEYKDEYDTEEGRHSNNHLPDGETKWENGVYECQMSFPLSIKVSAKQEANNYKKGEAIVELLLEDRSIYRIHHKWEDFRSYEVFTDGFDGFVLGVSAYLEKFAVIIGHSAFLDAEESVQYIQRPATLQEIEFEDVSGYFESYMVRNEITEMLDDEEVIAARDSGLVGEFFSNGSRFIDYSRGTLSIWEKDWIKFSYSDLQKSSGEINQRFEQLNKSLDSVYALGLLPPAHSKLPEVFQKIYPVVKKARQEARKLVKEKVKDWRERILADDKFLYFVPHRDLVHRLSGDDADIPEDEMTLIDKQGATTSAPKDIALEMSARICGLANYQYSIKSLRTFQTGAVPMRTRIREKR